MIDLASLTRFFMQLGLAVAGAAVLWLVFASYRHWRTTDQREKNDWILIENLLLLLLVISLFMAIAGWIALVLIFYPVFSLAHEGITIAPDVETIRRGLTTTGPLIILLAVAGLVVVFFPHYRQTAFYNYRLLFFGAIFGLISAVMVLILYRGIIDQTQIFYFLHHWHSIFTLGTVIVVDSLFLWSARRSASLRQTVYQAFPILSAVIWVGLGIDFLSNLLIFEEAFTVSDQFLFIQTVIAIIIINGALLSERINERLIQSVRRDNPRPLLGREKSLLGISGAISITSWLGITFIDFFTFPLVYWQFLTLYLLAIGAAFIIHEVVNRRINTYPAAA